MSDFRGYVVSDRFYRRIFYSEQGVEPVIVADALPQANPSVLFLVRYIIGEGAGGEIRRPIFRSELVGYDYIAQLDYPIQDTRIDNLQFLLEPYMYGSPAGSLTSTKVQSSAPGTARTVKAIISQMLVEELMHVYDYAW